MSVLEYGASGWFQELKTFGIELLWHPSLSEETGEEVCEILDRIERDEVPLDALFVEGSICAAPTARGSSTGWRERGAPCSNGSKRWRRVPVIA